MTNQVTFISDIKFGLGTLPIILISKLKNMVHFTFIRDFFIIVLFILLISSITSFKIIRNIVFDNFYTKQEIVNCTEKIAQYFDYNQDITEQIISIENMNENVVDPLSFIGFEKRYQHWYNIILSIVLVLYPIIFILTSKTNTFLIHDYIVYSVVGLGVCLTIGYFALSFISVLYSLQSVEKKDKERLLIRYAYIRMITSIVLIMSLAYIITTLPSIDDMLSKRMGNVM